MGQREIKFRAWDKSDKQTIEKFAQSNLSNSQYELEYQGLYELDKLRYLNNNCDLDENMRRLIKKYL